MKKIFTWLLTIFMAITALVYFPSITSIIALIFVVVALPVKPLQDFLADHGLHGKAKVILLCVVFLATAITVPKQAPADTRTVDNPSAASIAPGPSDEVESPTPDPTPEPTPTPESTPAPTPEPAPTPTPEPTPAPEDPSSAGPSSSSGGAGNGDGSNFNTWDNESQQNTSQAWVLNTSTKKIHYPDCKSVKKIAPQNYATSNATESELLARGYTKCGQCH